MRYVETVQPAENAPAEGHAAAAAEDPGVPSASRSERSPKDMAMSLLVLLVPIALLLGFSRVVLDGDEPVAVDPAPAIQQARSTDAFPVGEPVGLDADWHPVSADFRQVDGGRILRVGYVSPQGGGVQLVQSDVQPEQLLLAELTADGQAQGSVELAGRAWQRYTARAGERALVLLEPRRTVIVVGSADESELRELAGKLR